MKHIRLFLAAIAIFMGLGTALVPATATFAASPKQTVCETLGSNSSCTTDPSGGTGLNGIIKAVINILSLLVGITAVIMIIIGGLRYITSNGDSGSITSARNTILYAVIGLVIVAMAQAIVQFVLNRLK